MTKPPAVALDHVSKWYGQVIGINDISIAIDGGVTGILGMNGAGKSTPVSYTHLTLPTTPYV